jgi:hypothetical protein
MPYAYAYVEATLEVDVDLTELIFSWIMKK